MKCNLLSRFIPVLRKTIATAALPLMVVSALAVGPKEQLPNFDKRAAKAAHPNADKKTAIDRVSQKVRETKIHIDEILGAPSWVGSTKEFLTGKNGKGKAVSDAVAATIPDNDPHKPAKAFVKEHSDLFGFGPDALDAAKVKKDYMTKAGNFRTVVWQQHLDDIPVFESIFKAHWTADGELINVSSQFVADIAKASGKINNRKGLVAAPPISAKKAITLAARSIGDTIAEDEVTELGQPVGNEKRQQFRGGKVLNETQAHLTWLPLDDSTVQLCWQVMVVSRARGEGFDVLVDAQTGEIVVRHCLTEYLTASQYNVFTGDSPSPFSPAWSTPNTNQPALVARTLYTTAALDSTASPNGWINDGDNSTVGNNVDAHLDRNNDDIPDDGSRPTGSPYRVFNFPLDLTQEPDTYTNAVVVNLFYWNNWMHDQLYSYGFDESSGNYQKDNFGRGGVDSDAVQADAQDASVENGQGFVNPAPKTPQYNNANFLAPPDGIPGRMQMYVYQNGPGAPQRDGDLDSQTIRHEYAHGLSQRLVGGGTGMSQLQANGMGEGWSDFVSLSLGHKSGDDPNAVYAYGAYTMYNLAGSSFLQNYYFGARRYPYSTDLTKNPLTFKDIDWNQYSPHTGVPKNPLFGSYYQDDAAEVHSIGELWCSMLWECRASMIARYGSTSGNQMMLQTVVTAMKLSQSNPNFVASRDAILEADLVLTGAANHDIFWVAFSKRGLGYTATSPAGTTTTNVVEKFDLPPTYMTVAITSPTEEHVYSSTPTVSGTSTVPDANGYVQYQLFRFSDGKMFDFITGNWDSTFNPTNNLKKATGVANWSINLPTLSEDEYQINVRTIYQNTYVGDWFIRVFRIESLPPVVSFAPLTNYAVVYDLSQVRGQINKTVPLLQFRITQADNSGANTYWNGSSFIATNGTASSVWLNAAVSGNNWTAGTNALPTRAQTRFNGYVLDVRAQDGIGVLATNQILVIRSADDTTPPDLTIDTITNNQVITNNYLPGIGGVANDAETGIATVDAFIMRQTNSGYLYYDGSGHWTETPTSVHAIYPTVGNRYGVSSIPAGANLPNGQYQVQVYAQNRETPAGTVGVSVSFTVDYHPVFVWTEGSYYDNINGNENHNWDNGANWDQGTTPTADAVVIIPSGTCDASMMGSINNIYRVDISGGVLQVTGLFTKKLNVSAGILAGGAINIDGSGGVFNWSGGQINGTYGILAGATLNLFGGTKTFGGSGTTLNNAGTINWTNGVIYNYAYNAVDLATINNQSNATFNVYGDGPIFDHQYNPSIFNNLPGATFVKANSFGTSTNGHFTFNNAGEIRVDSGILLFNSSINLNLQNGSVEKGSIVCDNATLNFQGATTIASNTVVLRSGTLHGDTNSTVTTSGAAELHWSGGTLDGVVEITPNSQFVLDTSALKTFNSAAVLRNRGRVYWIDSGNIYNYAYTDGQQAKIDNLSGAYIYIDTDATLSQEYRPSALNNLAGGTIIKAFGTATNQVFWQLNNDGLVTTGTGALMLNGGGISGGQFDAGAGTFIRFGSGTHTLNNGTLFTGNGAIQIDGATVTRNGTIYGPQSTPTTLDLITGTFNGAGALAQRLTVNWIGTTIGGQLDVGSNVVVNVSGSALKTLGDGAVVNNFGAFNWSGPGQIYNYGYYGGTQATFVNEPAAVFKMIADGDVFKQDYNRSYFTNLNGAMIVKTSGTGTNVLARFGVENFGEIRANTGTLQFNEMLNLNQGSTISGAANVVLSGTVTMNAPVTNTGNVTVDVGNIVGAVSTNGAPLSSYAGSGTFKWTGGFISGKFVLLANNSVDFTGSTFKTFTDGAIFENYGTVNWSGPGTLYNYGYFGGTQATFNNHSNAAFNLLTDGQVFQQNYNASMFSNMVGAVVAKIGGTGTNIIDGFRVENSGEIRAQTGHLQFNGVLNLASGSTLTGAAAIHLAGNTTLTGTATGSAASISFDSGSLTGTNATYNGTTPLTWLTGTLYGTLTIQPGSTMNLSGSTDKTMGASALLNNGGTVNWNGPGRVYNYGLNATDAAFIANLPNAHFNLLTDGEVFVNQYAGAYFTNQLGAHFTKVLGTGTNNIHAFSIVNFGDIGAVSGTVQFTDKLETAGGTFSGAGTIQSLGNTTLHGAMDINGPQFKLLNGTFTADTAANISCENGGAFEWQGGVLAGSLRVNAGAKFNVAGAGIKEFGANSVLDNAGTMTVSSGNLYNYNYFGTQQATLNNLAGGLIDCTGDATFTVAYNRSTINNNAGATFRKSSATTTANGWNFNNNGTLDLRNGTFVNDALSLGTNGVVNMGILTTNSNAQLTQNGALAFVGGLNLLANGVPLTNGLSFTLANYSSATGAFLPLTLPPLPQGSKWKLTYGSSTLTAAIVASTVLSSPTKDGHGGFQLSLNGEPASAAILQTSIDLNAWTSVSTNSPFTGTFGFNDTPAAGETKKFYRILMVP